MTTPEKWDIVTRKSGDRTYTQLVCVRVFVLIGPPLSVIWTDCTFAMPL